MTGRGRFFSPGQDDDIIVNSLMIVEDARRLQRSKANKAQSESSHLQICALCHWPSQSSQALATPRRTEDSPPFKRLYGNHKTLCFSRQSQDNNKHKSVSQSNANAIHARCDLFSEGAERVKGRFQQRHFGTDSLCRIT